MSTPSATVSPLIVFRTISKNSDLNVLSTCNPRLVNHVRSDRNSSWTLRNACRIFGPADLSGGGLLDRVRDEPLRVVRLAA